MTINRTAYDTLACNGFQLKKLLDAINYAQHSIGFSMAIDSDTVRLLEGGDASTNNIPSFVHPIIYDRICDRDAFLVDVRSFGKWNPIQCEFNIKNNIEYSMTVNRAKINSIWTNNTVNILRDISQFPLTIFACWVSEAIGKRFALDPREQFNLYILSGIFYYSQFTNETELGELEKIKLINILMKALKAPSEDVMGIVDKYSVITDVKHFCAVTEDVTGSIRLKDFNPGLLFSIIGNTWYSTNSKEIIAVALEHPPTWMTILMYASSERGFKNSQISKIVERNMYKKTSEDYTRSILNLLNNGSKF